MIAHPPFASTLRAVLVALMFSVSSFVDYAGADELDGAWKLPIHESAQANGKVIGYALYSANNELLGLVSNYNWRDTDYSGVISNTEKLFGDFRGSGQALFVATARKEHLRLIPTDSRIDIDGIEEMWSGVLTNYLDNVNDLALRYNFLQQIISKFSLPWQAEVLIETVDGYTPLQVLISRLGVPILEDLLEDSLLGPPAIAGEYQIDYRDAATEPVFSYSDYVAAPPRSVFVVTSSQAPSDSESALQWSISPRTNPQVFLDASGTSNNDLSVTAVTQELSIGDSISIESVFPSHLWVDNDGNYDVVAFAIQDRTVGGGHLEVDGIPVPEATVFEFPISDLSNWRFVAADSSSTDEIGFNIIQGDGDFSPRLTPGALLGTVTNGSPQTLFSASRPEPADATSGNLINSDLDWSNGGGATSYRVFFGEDPTPDSSEFVGTTTSSAFNLPLLDCGKEYFWRVNSVRDSEELTGEVWSFSTESCDSGPSDLIVQNVVVDNLSPAENEDFEISVRVRNRGDSVSPSTITRFYQSADSFISTNDIELESETTRSLSPGSYDEEDRSVAISSAGTYWVGACVDTVLGETSTSNNCSAGIQVSVVEADVDLDFTALTIADSEPYSSFFRLDALVINIGNSETQDTTINYYLSYDQLISESDILLGSDNLDGLNPNDSDTPWEVLAYNVPGVYWVGGCVVPATDLFGGVETALVNNCSAGVELTIPEPFETNETGHLTRASVDSKGYESNLSSDNPAISADGRYVVFVSESVNLVPGVGKNDKNIFLHDLELKLTEHVSVDSNGDQGNRNNYDPAISADGRYVAFRSYNSFVAEDTNDTGDIYLHDRHSGLTKRVTVGLGGAEPDRVSGDPVLSEDGRFIAFESSATNLVPSDLNGVKDIFLYDDLTGVISRVSVSQSGVESDATSNNPSISSDGRYVAFNSRSTTLVAVPDNGEYDVFVKDMITGEVTLASVNDSGARGNDFSGGATLSSSGRYVAFSSDATNLVPNDNNGASDIFVRDMHSLSTTRVSVSSAGVEGDLGSQSPSISADGSFVTFQSDATNLVQGDSNGKTDVFLRDVQVGATSRISSNESLSEADDHSFKPSISEDGSVIAFYSIAGNLVVNDSNGVSDVFVYKGSSPVDTDGDGLVDSEDSDDDNDGWEDIYDNCPLVANPNQEDADFDNVGDLCDNCLINANPAQEDLDSNGVGDICEGLGC